MFDEYCAFQSPGPKDDLESWLYSSVVGTSYFNVDSLCFRNFSLPHFRGVHWVTFLSVHHSIFSLFYRACSLDKKAKEQTYKLKLESRTHFRHVLFRNCPEEFSTFIDIIDSYSYYDKPDYGRVIRRHLIVANLSFSSVSL